MRRPGPAVPVQDQEHAHTLWFSGSLRAGRTIRPQITKPA